MTLKLTWEEFVDAAMANLREKHPIDSFPRFMTRGSYEPDGEAYTFPPHYVELDLKAGEEPPKPKGAVTFSVAHFEDQPDVQTQELRDLSRQRGEGGEE